MSDYQLFTVLVALFVAVTGWWRVWLDAENLKERMFDRRFAVFQSARNLLTHILREADVSPEALTRYRAGTVDAMFLIDDVELLRYLDETIWQKASRLGYCVRVINSGLPEARQNNLPEEVTVLLGWFYDQFDELARRFRPHLHVRHRGGWIAKLGI